MIKCAGSITTLREILLLVEITETKKNQAQENESERMREGA